LSIISVAVHLIGASFSTPALAGSCPEEHILSEPRNLEKVKGQGVKIETREQIELGGWRDMTPLPHADAPFRDKTWRPRRNAQPWRPPLDPLFQFGQSDRPTALVREGVV